MTPPINITIGDMATITSYAGDIFQGLFPVFAIVIGIGIVGLLWDLFVHRK